MSLISPPTRSNILCMLLGRAEFSLYMSIGMFTGNLAAFKTNFFNVGKLLNSSLYLSVSQARNAIEGIIFSQLLFNIDGSVLFCKDFCNNEHSVYTLICPTVC